jgi:hypothetical protein
MLDLTEQLSASLAAVRDGARFVDPATLPTEKDLVAVHAQLSRVIREQPKKEATSG